MQNSKKLVKLKYGIWAVATIWVLFDLGWLYTRGSFGSEAFIAHLIWAACIPLLWWIEKVFFRFLYSEFMFKRGRKLMAAFRSFNLYFFAIGMLMPVSLKLFIGLSADEVETPFPALAFVIGAAAFYFSLLSRAAQLK